MPRGPSPLTEGFAAALRQARIEAKLTQEQLAHVSGLHPVYVSMLERGKASPSLAVVERLANTLGTRAHRLVKAAEDSAPRRPRGAAPKE